MIEIFDERLTPKQAAQVILLSTAQNVAYWPESFALTYERATERERRLINEQLDKQYDRMQRLFGHEGWRITG